MKKIKYSTPILIMIMFTSCSTFHEIHYFKDKVDTKNGISLVPNYYKVEIRGYSLISSSRYLSGYFEQSAINLYFNEMTQPKEAKLFNKTDDNEMTQPKEAKLFNKTDDDDKTFTNEKGNELILILSTNAKAVSDQIGNIAKNQDILNSLATITQKEKYTELTNVKSEISKVESDINNFIFLSNNYLKDISKTAATEDEKKQKIKQYINSLNNL